MEEKFIRSIRKVPCLWNTNLYTYKCNESKDVAWEQVVRENRLPDVKTAKARWKRLRDNHRDALKRRNATRSGQTTKQNREWKFEKLMEFLVPHMITRQKPASQYTIRSDLVDDSTRTSQYSNEDEPPNNGRIGSTCEEEEPPRATNSPPEIVLHEDSSDHSSFSIISSLSRTGKRRSDEILDVLKQQDEQMRKARTDIQSILIRNGAPDEMDNFFLSLSQTVKKLPLHLQLQTKRTVFNAVMEAEEANLESSWGPFSQDRNHAASSESDACFLKDIKLPRNEILQNTDSNG